MVRPKSTNGQRIPEIFEPDIILPTQFTIPRGRPAQGERALLLAVLEMALRDLELSAGKKAKLRYPAPPDAWEFRYTAYSIRSRYWKAVRDREALIAWFRSDSTEDAFTFVSICENFGLEPDAIRRQLEHRGWAPVRAPTHQHATAQHPRQLHGRSQGGQ